MEDDVVDLTSLTPRLEDKGEIISLLTPQSDSGKRPLESLETLSIENDIRLYKRIKENVTKQPPPYDPTSGTVSPITDALQKFLASRLEPIKDSDKLQEATISKQRPNESPVCSEDDEEKAVREELESEIAVEPAVEQSLRKPCDEVLRRKQVCRGQDDVIIEMSLNSEQSPFSSALYGRIDESARDRLPFCCLVQNESILPGRKSVTWLRRSKKQNKKDAPTHEYIPYILIFLEASEVAEEVHKDGMESLVYKVSRNYPDSKVCFAIVGMDKRMMRRGRNGGLCLAPSQIDEALVSLFVKYTGIAHLHVADYTEAAEYVVNQSTAFLKISQGNQNRSFLHVFGGCKQTEAINVVDLALHSSAQPIDVSLEKLLEWINLLHAVPGVGPKDAHGIALKYSSFLALMEAYEEESRSEEDKRMLVADIIQPSEKSRRIGQAASAALYKFFCSRDSENVFE